MSMHRKLHDAGGPHYVAVKRVRPDGVPVFSPPASQRQQPDTRPQQQPTQTTEDTYPHQRPAVHAQRINTQPLHLPTQRIDTCPQV